MSEVLPTRSLGRDGPKVPALGLGLMGLSSFYGVPPSDEERFAFLDRAHELGCTHWDSAALYGDSEELLGKWFRRTGKRKDAILLFTPRQIFLTTKFGNCMTPDGGREIRNDPGYIRRSITESLRRLQTDHIDLLYCHRISGETPIEHIIATMKDFVDAGTVRYLGLSECGVDTLRRAVKVHPIHAYQIEYSPFSRDIELPEIGLLKTCRELGIATVAYSPLGRGVLTGQYKSPEDFDETDFRRSIPRFSRENFHKNVELVDMLQGIAAKKGCTSGQLSLAWLMKQGDDIFPIPGTKKIKYLEENVGACAVCLTDEEDKVIREAIENTEVYGTRVAESLMDALVKDTPPLT
ncbi:putative aldo-keto reductase [Durotheca rogersii]|uniref:putative aldo-keto reductase n=1 Tax=Durotheca rogersii TaxID=419775 RepID=UPI00221FF5E9|nr:putative aldo-keto reductase [Durotheca rogersii]KAI5860469.1 putative aldo-keto reductase [Durotheca rogersii]